MPDPLPDGRQRRTDDTFPRTGSCSGPLRRRVLVGRQTVRRCIPPWRGCDDDRANRDPSVVGHAQTLLRADQRHARPAEPVSEYAHAVPLGAQCRQGTVEAL